VQQFARRLVPCLNSDAFTPLTGVGWLVEAVSYINQELSLAHGSLYCTSILLVLKGSMRMGEFADHYVTVAYVLQPILVNPFIKNKKIHAKSECFDVNSLGGVMMELMEPKTCIQTVTVLFSRMLLDGMTLRASKSFSTLCSIFLYAS
jgi:hypothetical protein